MCQYLDSLLMAVDLQGTAAVLRERRHVEIEGRRSAFPLLHTHKTIIRSAKVTFLQVLQSRNRSSLHHCGGALWDRMWMRVKREGMRDLLTWHWKHGQDLPKWGSWKTHRFKWNSKKTIGSLKTHADSLNGECDLKQELLHLHSDTTTNR